VSPNDVRLPLASSDSTTVLIQRVTGFTDAVDLAMPILPPGVGASFNPDPAGGGSSSLTLTVGANAPLGTHTLRVHGTGHNVTKTALLTLRLRQFVLTLSDSGPILIAGGPAVFITVTINRSPGFTDSVALSVEGLPLGTPAGAGVSAILNPSSTTGTTSSLQLKAGRFAPTQDLALTFRGSSGNLVETVMLGVQVLGLDLP
jgi:hypothetical protein